MYEARCNANRMFNDTMVEKISSWMEIASLSVKNAAYRKIVNRWIPCETEVLRHCSLAWG